MPIPPKKKPRKEKVFRRHLWLLPFLLVAGGLSAILLQSHWFFALAARVKPGALYRVDLPAKAPKTVALTIDDGPSADTAEILNVLKKHSAKATFFNISSRVAAHPAAVTRTVQAGHELGNHLTRDEPSARLSLEEFEADMLKAQATLSPYLTSSEDQQLRWLRPGMGWYSADMVDIAERHGYQLALGSLFPYDTHIPSVNFASTFILSKVQSGDIIVLHDGTGRSQRTIATLERILPVLTEKGYQVTTLSELDSLAAD